MGRFCNGRPTAISQAFWAVRRLNASEMPWRRSGSITRGGKK